MIQYKEKTFRINTSSLFQIHFNNIKTESKHQFITINDYKGSYHLPETNDYHQKKNPCQDSKLRNGTYIGFRKQNVERSKKRCYY